MCVAQNHMAQGCWLEKWSVSNISSNLSTSITHPYADIHPSAKWNDYRDVRSEHIHRMCEAAIIKRCLLNTITNKSQTLNAINCLLVHFNWQDIIFHRHSTQIDDVWVCEYMQICRENSHFLRIYVCFQNGKGKYPWAVLNII